MSIISDDYFTRPEAADELEVCERTLVRWERAGEGPAITRIGKRPLYRRATIAAWLAAREAAL